VVGRLLERLQNGVRGLLGEHVRLVHDVDLHAAAGRPQRHPIADLADVVDAAVAGRIHFDHVDGGGVVDAATRLADEAGGDRRPLLAVDRFGQDLGHGGLTGAARTGEQVCVRNPVELDGVSERLHHVRLPDHLAEVLRAMGAVES